MQSLKLTTLEVAEQSLHESVADLLAKVVLPPAEWSCFPAGSVPLPARFAAKLNRMGLQRGWPDFLVIYERIYGIELKRRGGRLSTTRIVRTRRGGPRVLIGQTEMFPRLQRAGMTISVCHDTDEVLAALTGWKVPCRWAHL